MMNKTFNTESNIPLGFYPEGVYQFKKRGFVYSSFSKEWYQKHKNKQNFWSFVPKTKIIEEIQQVCEIIAPRMSYTQDQLKTFYSMSRYWLDIEKNFNVLYASTDKEEEQNDPWLKKKAKKKKDIKKSKLDVFHEAMNTCFIKGQIKDLISCKFIENKQQTRTKFIFIYTPIDIVYKKD